MMDQPDTGDGLLNRAELEIELARFALKLARRVQPGQAPGVALWIQDEATALIARIQPEYRPWTGQRVRQIAWSLAGVEVQVVAASFGLTIVAQGCGQAPTRADEAHK